MSDLEKEFKEVNSIFEKDKYIQVNPDINIKDIEGFDLYKKVKHAGRDLYVLFHSKGASLNRKVPGKIYVKASVEEALLKLSPKVKAKETENLIDTLTQILLEDHFKSKILDNNELELEKKIELTVHCAGEVMKKIFESGKFDHFDLKTIMKLSESLCYLIDLIFQDHRALNLLLNETIGHDYKLYTHCVNVSLFSGLLAMELGNDVFHGAGTEALKTLITGALIHDIGKMLIDSKIFDKKGPLSPKEFEEIKRHPVYGIKLVEPESLPEEVHQIILQHHEKWTGGGYPQNLSYQQISNFARIACISDVFDALTTKKPYRPALKPFEALLLMKQKMIGKFYHPYLNVFIKFLGKGSQK
ncbi:MAG TPA: HD domain-containing phosphohydrolase [archaeon]|nr:HD domain-containing phosphohydrolase [archaeon]